MKRPQADQAGRPGHQICKQKSCKNRRQTHSIDLNVESLHMPGVEEGPQVVGVPSGRGIAAAPVEKPLAGKNGATATFQVLLGVAPAA